MSNKDSYTSKEWQTLQFAPLWVFTQVALADKTIDKKEVEAFTKAIQDAPLYKEPLVREVLMSVVIGFDSVMKEYNSDSRGVISGLGDTASVLDKKADPEQANNFKKALLLIGSEVAKASGGGGILKRDPVSGEERTALAWIALSLKVSL